jgi:hypothetical protein
MIPATKRTPPDPDKSLTSAPGSLVRGRVFRLRQVTGAAGLEPATPGFGVLCSLSSHAGFRLLRARVRASRQPNDLAGGGAGQVLVQPGRVVG